jgi:hypothetical protein
MAVTTSSMLRFSDVCREIYGNSSTIGKTLVGAHAAAASGWFNSTYAVLGTVDTLLDFRGYSHTEPLITFYRTNASSKGALACNISATTAVYHNGSASLPAVNDIVYTNNPGTTFLGNYEYGMATSSGGNVTHKMTINTVGVVTSKTSCI